MLQSGHRRTDGFHALARPPCRFKLLDSLIDADPYGVYNLLGVVLVPPMSLSVVTTVISEKTNRPWVRIILWEFELMQGNNLRMPIEDDEPCRAK